jgi:hypothetical protein
MKEKRGTDRERERSAFLICVCVYYTNTPNMHIHTNTHMYEDIHTKCTYICMCMVCMKDPCPPPTCVWVGRSGLVMGVGQRKEKKMMMIMNK